MLPKSLSLLRYFITKVPWLSAKLRNVYRKIVHSAIERKGSRFHRVLKYTGICVRFSIHRNTLPYFFIVFHRRSGMSGSSLSFKRTGLLGCLLGTLIRQRRSPEF